MRVILRFKPMPGPHQVEELILRTETTDAAEAVVKAILFAQASVTTAPLREIIVQFED